MIVTSQTPSGRESAQPLPELTARPRHVAIIMDGNGRWATARGLGRSEGHRAGAEAIRDRKSTRLNSSHSQQSRMPSSA